MSKKQIQQSSTFKLPFGCTSVNKDTFSNMDTNWVKRIEINSQFMTMDEYLKKRSAGYFQHPIYPKKSIELNEYAFSNFKNLETVRVPAEFISIDEKAFDGCEKLNTILFTDDTNNIESSWNLIWDDDRDYFPPNEEGFFKKSRHVFIEKVPFKRVKQLELFRAWSLGYGFHLSGYERTAVKLGNTSLLVGNPQRQGHSMEDSVPEISENYDYYLAELKKKQSEKTKTL